MYTHKMNEPEVPLEALFRELKVSDIEPHTPAQLVISSQLRIERRTFHLHHLTETQYLTFSLLSYLSELVSK